MNRARQECERKEVSGQQLGGSVTWAPPSHQYSDCVNKATGHRDNLWQACENGFEAAKHARTD